MLARIPLQTLQHVDIRLIAINSYYRKAEIFRRLLPIGWFTCQWPITHSFHIVNFLFRTFRIFLTITSNTYKSRGSCTHRTNSSLSYFLTTINGAPLQGCPIAKQKSLLWIAPQIVIFFVKSDSRIPFLRCTVREFHMNLDMNTSHWDNQQFLAMSSFGFLFCEYLRK